MGQKVVREAREQTNALEIHTSIKDDRARLENTKRDVFPKCYIVSQIIPLQAEEKTGKAN